jgi:anionic cell wall polymer biosynthesis LytR-Cps2A-Psr (LCP) family protein
MNKALRFRRRLAWTWVVVAGVLLAAFYVAVKGAGEAIAQEGSVAHAQEVLRAIVDARLKRARVTNYLLTFQMKPAMGMDPHLYSDVRELQEDLAGQKPYSPMALGRQVREILDQIEGRKPAK